MKLSENPKLVETLKRILKEYDYLEYDENRSKGDVLYVKVTSPTLNAILISVRIYATN